MVIIKYIFKMMKNRQTEGKYVTKIIQLVLMIVTTE